MNESERPSSEIAAELGIQRNQLYKWKEQLDAKGAESLTHIIKQKSASLAFEITDC